MPPIIQPRRLPTVRLVHRKDPKNVRVVDQRIYAIAPERWRDFKIDTFLNQQADPDVVETAVREWEVNEKRLTERDAGKDWEFRSKQSDHNVVTESVTDGAVDKFPSAPKPPEVFLPTPKRRGRPPKVKA